MKPPKEVRIADAPLNPPLETQNTPKREDDVIPDFWENVLESGATPPKSGAKVAHCEATCHTQPPESKGENRDSGASGAFLHITNINHRTHCAMPYREAQWRDAPLPPLSPSHMVSESASDFVFPDPAEAAQTLLETMRAIGLRVRLTVQGELRIGPQHMLWPYDIETITELKPELIEILQKELHQ